MLAYLQKKQGEFLSVNGYVAWDGLRLLGFECRFFEFEQIDELRLDRDTLVHGSVGAVHRALDKIGVARPNLHPAPPELRPFFGRWVREATLGDVRAMDTPVFVKPLREHKRFTGYVRRSELDDINRTSYLDDSFEVVLSEVVPMISEWRCFVLEQKCIGARPYAGLPTSPVPDVGVAIASIEALGRTAPVAYSVDIARLNDGSTVVVEVNDAYALGSYGMPSIPYAQMIDARWQQLVGAK